MILKSFSQELNVFSFDQLITSDISITSKISFLKILNSKYPEKRALWNSTNYFNLLRARGSNFVILFLFYDDILDNK